MPVHNVDRCYLWDQLLVWGKCWFSKEYDFIQSPTQINIAQQWFKIVKIIIEQEYYTSSSAWINTYSTFYKNSEYNTWPRVWFFSHEWNQRWYDYWDWLWYWWIYEWRLSTNKRTSIVTFPSSWTSKNNFAIISEFSLDKVKYKVWKNYWVWIWEWEQQYSSQVAWFVYDIFNSGDAYIEHWDTPNNYWSFSIHKATVYYE